MDKEDEYGVDLCDKCPFDVIEVRTADNWTILISKMKLIENIKLPNCQITNWQVEKAEDYINEDERLCTFIDDDDCRATFVYGYHNSTCMSVGWTMIYLT